MTSATFDRSIVDLPGEDWRDVDDYPGYQVSNLGRVRSLLRYAPRILAVGLDDHRYPRVRMTNRSGERALFVHVIVARSFIGPRPDGHEVNHKNLDTMDARASNLEYVTRRENIDHYLREHGCSDGSFKAGERHRGAKLTAQQALDVSRSTEPAPVLASRFVVSVVTIDQVRNGKNWSTVTGIAPKKTEGTPRRCPICKELGHNSRTCARRSAA